MESFHAEYMNRAIELAKRGEGFVNPNPKVGAVIVKNGKIIGEGYHMRYGDLHAERNALKNCKEDPQGASIYVTLEPCCHTGKQPPCTEAIIESGIKQVFIGSRDPNPLVHGKGIQQLREAGVQVEMDLMREECDALNPGFFHFIQTRTPFVTLKYAMTLDGKIATYTGKSQWISGPESRKNVHRTRNEHTGIMVGIGTILADNPSLTCREVEGLDPIRIVCDSELRTPLDANILTDIPKSDINRARTPRTILATCVSEESRLLPYKERGAEVLTIPRGEDGHLNLPTLMSMLGDRNIDSILLEGGGTLAWSMLESKLVHRVQAYIAPKIFGGETSPTPVRGQGFPEIPGCTELEKITYQIFGNDILIEGRVKACSQES